MNQGDYALQLQLSVSLLIKITYMGLSFFVHIQVTVHKETVLYLCFTVCVIHTQIFQAR